MLVLAGDGGWRGRGTYCEPGAIRADVLIGFDSDGKLPWGDDVGVNRGAVDTGEGAHEGREGDGAHCGR